jgi:MFS family permease
MMNALQINPSWKSFYNYPEKAKLGAINAMMPTGKIIGFIFVAPFSNTFGRKKALVLAFTISVIGAAIQAASVNLELLIFSRFFLGFGCGVMSQPSPILLAELAYPPHRGKVTALYHCFYVSTYPFVEVSQPCSYISVCWCHRRSLDHLCHA